MPNYANVLVKVVANLGVINRVPAATPAHNFFCYSTVAHILTPSVNLAFGSKSRFKNKGAKQVENEKIHPPPTNSKNRLKSVCEVGYVNIIGQMCLLLARGYQWRFC